MGMPQRAAQAVGEVFGVLRAGVWLERDLSGSTRSAIRVMAFPIIQAAFARGPGSPQITDGSRTVLISDASWSAASYPSGA